MYDLENFMIMTKNNDAGDVWRCKHDKKSMENSKIGRSHP